jgi:FkbM family methyltransferase
MDTIKKTTMHFLASIASRFCKVLPILSGPGTLTQMPPLCWLEISPEDQVWIKLPNGLSVLVLSNDFIGRATYFFGDHDPKIFRALKTVLDSTVTLIDIGANVGTVALRCATLAKRVVAVEPQPVCASLLQQSIIQNNLHNVELYELALTSSDGIATIYVGNPSNSGTVSLDSDGRRTTGIMVRTLRAGKFLTDLKIEGNYVIKIDVEGHEEPVLRSALDYFHIHAPLAILFECHTPADKEFASLPIVHLISTLNMKIYEIHKAIFRLTLTPIDPLRRPRGTDFLAIMGSE